MANVEPVIAAKTKYQVKTKKLVDIESG